jgi:hypothetical protein
MDHEPSRHESEHGLFEAAHLPKDSIAKGLCMCPGGYLCALSFIASAAPANTGALQQRSTPENDTGRTIPAGRVHAARLVLREAPTTDPPNPGPLSSVCQFFRRRRETAILLCMIRLHRSTPSAFANEC